MVSQTIPTRLPTILFLTQISGISAGTLESG
jgi:hypothetical protein